MVRNMKKEKRKIYGINRNFISFFILVIAIGFIVYGAMRGEDSTVLVKAVKVCLECVGIG